MPPIMCLINNILVIFEGLHCDMIRRLLDDERNLVIGGMLSDASVDGASLGDLGEEVLVRTAADGVGGLAMSWFIFKAVVVIGFVASTSICQRINDNNVITDKLKSLFSALKSKKGQNQVNDKNGKNENL